MQRRTLLKALALTGATASLAACSTEPAPAAQPSASAAPATTAPTGTFAIESEKLELSRGSDRPLPTTIWYPTSGGPFALILFSHGLTATPSEYETLLIAWAKAGFAVAAPAYPHTSAGVRDYNALDVLNQPADASYVITELLQRYPGQIDTDRIAAAGHSAGGVTTLGMLSGTRDTRLKAAVVLAGRQLVTTPLQGAATPILFVHGKLDDTVAIADARSVYNAMTWPKAFMTVTRGNHVATSAELPAIAATSTDFWRWSLFADETAKSRLAADATEGGLATFEESLDV
ncbi:alpha/beta hydrolase family protein [Paractinoplanes ferrugineus]|uniref:alpha/beta hydrolase family protein n=1 Tax=Paractinoplanes ferrugineus TaxID=113564 RepID=UPI0019427DEC|nr:prolyl oligopeptidase family serine peptidase [Actinoplanes ferrugineus]